MKNSIKSKVLAYFMGVVLIVLGVIWLGIKFYINEFYYGEKIEIMTSTIDKLNDIFSQRNPDEIIRDLEYLGYEFGGKISIYDGNSVLTILNKNIDYQKGILIKEIKHKNSIGYIFETSYPSIGTRWLLYGEKLDNSKFAILEVPIESIENTLAFVEKFFSYLVLISIIVAGLFSIVLSRNIYKPLKELNIIAKEMGKLNFNKKYIGKRKDEIGQLGNTLNEITGILEKTILELQIELNKEKKLDVMRRNFIGQVSHELQTPLSIINGYIEALEDKIVDTEDERQYYYEIIGDEASKMSKMIKELLDLSQLESGTFKMKKEKVDIVSLIEAINMKYEKIAFSRNILWNYVGIEETINLDLDPLRFEQALTNIINNAFKHTDENKEILFKIIKKESNLFIIIENEGENILEEEIGMIWESFFKGSSNKKIGGTGLGLAIAANIFKYHNIKYRAYNKTNGVGFELEFRNVLP